MPDESPDQIAMLRALLARENPAAQSAVIQSMGGMGKLMSGGAMATTNPLTGAISINTDTTADPQDLEDTLRHELVHKNQIDKMTPLDKVGAVGTGFAQGIGLGTPYGQRPDEMEAYQVQNDARQKKGLPSSPTPTFGDTRTWAQRTLPAFLGGQDIPMQANQDIQLPSSTRMAAQRQHIMEQELLRRQQQGAPHGKPVAD
jgi:hypothetical protein